MCLEGISIPPNITLPIFPPGQGIRPVVHWSESPDDVTIRRNAHSDYVRGPISLWGEEARVDVMIESKSKELALLRYRQAVLAASCSRRPVSSPPAGRTSLLGARAGS